MSQGDDRDLPCDSRLVNYNEPSIFDSSPIPKGMASNRSDVASQELYPTESLTKHVYDVKNPEDLVVQYDIQKKIQSKKHKNALSDVTFQGITGDIELGSAQLQKNLRFSN